jgi:hypothetical protein
MSIPTAIEGNVYQAGAEAPKKEALNTFGFRDIYSQGYHVYAWQVVYNGETLSGTASSVRSAYRDAKRAVRRFRKMYKFLNKGS